MALLWSFFTHDEINQCRIVINLARGLVCNGEVEEAKIRLQNAKELANDQQKAQIESLLAQCNNH
jgi:hypothetical protein